MIFEANNVHSENSKEAFSDAAPSLSSWESQPYSYWKHAKRRLLTNSVNSEFPWERIAFRFQRAEIALLINSSCKHHRVIFWESAPLSPCALFQCMHQCSTLGWANTTTKATKRNNEENEQKLNKKSTARPIQLGMSPAKCEICSFFVTIYVRIGCQCWGAYVWVS